MASREGDRGSYATLVIGWVTKTVLSQAPPYFKRHVKPLVPAAFAVVSIHQLALGPRVYGPFSLWVIQKEDLCSSSGDINMLMMIEMDADFTTKILHRF
jgi:hypothetical protein